MSERMRCVSVGEAEEYPVESVGPHGRVASLARASIVIAEQAADYVVDDETLSHAELNWQGDALCAQTDPEVFFPERNGAGRIAKKICLSCDVRVNCLEYAIANDDSFGIWGGLSEQQRQKLKKQANT